MPAYLLLLVAVLSRLLPHAGWMNFTAVGGALLYFGARRSWREMLAPLAALMATDYFLTVYSYHYAFRWQGYVPTWAWYVMAMALGQILLQRADDVCARGGGRAAGADLVLPGLELCGLGERLACIRTRWAGWAPAIAAGLPFYRNDLLSTAIVCRAGLWGSGAGAADERGAGAGGAGGEVGSVRCRQVRQVEHRCAG